MRRISILLAALLTGGVNTAVAGEDGSQPSACVELEMLGPLRQLSTGSTLTDTNAYTLLRRSSKDPLADARKALGITTPREPKLIVLDGAQEGRMFEGIGACSAGASSRLLIEYTEPYRAQILDYLFKPNYGAGFQHLKVEIGGDVNSTDGCEPSHMHTREDQDYHRGYEWWLMKEARRRNPNIFLDCLEWGAPAWIGHGNFYSQDNADYIVNFLKGARKVHGLDIAYVGIWNETRADMGWIKLLRQTLDRTGFGAVQIVAPDDVNRWNLVEVMKSDPELANAVQVVGVHYPKFTSPPAAQTCGKPIWSSEDGPWKGNWDGASALAKAYNRNYAEGKMTKTIIWSPVTAYYDNLPLPGSGVMRANSPWSGHYEVQPALWATAHTTQFASPGWKYLDGAGCGLLPDGGSYVCLKSTNNQDFSVIVETINAKASQEVAFQVSGGLSKEPVHVWRSGPDEQFVQIADLRPADGRLATTFETNRIYSLSTTRGQQKGAATPPPPAQFPLPYVEDFESYKPGATPRCFADQSGIFQIEKRKQGKGMALRQIITEKGIEWPFHLNPPPESFLGDPTWLDYTVAVDVLIEGAGYAALFGRVGAVPQNANLPSGYLLKLDERGNWEFGTATMALVSGRVPASPNAWCRLQLTFDGKQVRVLINEKPLADVTDSTYASGMVGVGCGWHRAQFDNLSIQMDPRERNLAFGKATAASSSADVDSGPACATDGNAYTTRWTASEGKTAAEWLEVDLGADQKFNTVCIRPFEDRVTAYKLQFWTGTEWSDAHVSTNGLGSSPRVVTFPDVTARRVRLHFTAAKSSPSIWELELRHRATKPQ